MSCFIRMMRQIICINSRTMVLRLRRIRPRNQYNTSVIPKPAIFVPSCQYTSMTKIQPAQTSTFQKNDDEVDELTEISFAHRFFESSMYYADTIIDPYPPPLSISKEQEEEFLKTDFSNPTESQVILALKLLSHIKKTEKSQEILSTIYNVICTECKNYQNDTIVSILKGLVHVYYNNYRLPPDTTSPTNIDRQCLERFSKSSIPEMLKITYILQFLHLYNRSFNFPQLAIMKISRKPQKLTSKQLVQLLFLISIYRKPAPNMYELEYKLEQHKEELSISELGIGALGFFKSRTTIKSLDLLEYIVGTAKKHVNDMDNYTLSAILKLIRYSLQLPALVKVEKLMALLEPRIKDINLMTVTHISEALVSLNLYKISALRLISERLKQELSTARVKDIERICLCLCHFYYKEDDSVYNDLITEITRRINSDTPTDCEKHVLCLPRMLSFLSQIDIYPHTLLKHIMSDKYINHICGGNFCKLNYCYYYLNFSVQIDDPSYDGPLLSRLAMNLQGKNFDKLNNDMTMHKPKRQLSDVIYYCKEIIQLPDAMFVGHYLPQYPLRDIIIGLNEHMKPVPIKQIISNLPSYAIKHVSRCFPPNVQIIVLVMGSNQHKLRGTQKPPGHFIAKVRQLERLGCKPQIVWFDVWSELNNAHEKAAYLKHLIFSHDKSDHKRLLNI